MARALKIEVRGARLVVDDLRRHRIAAGKLLKEVGLRRADLIDPETPDRLFLVLGLMERAATLVDDASYGLRFGASRSQRDSGLIGFVLLNSPTLMDALSNVQRYFRVIGGGEDFEDRKRRAARRPPLRRDRPGAARIEA
jgi:hypothetical protein